MEQKEAVMVLFDREEEYARLLSEFLRRQKELPWEIHTYTKMEELLEREKNGEVTMLVVAESSCMDTLSTLEPACQAILNESGTLRFHQFPNINKYQEADKVWKELLELYVETVGTQLPFLCAEYKTKFIGIYSPVHRCLQSSFALTLGQLLSEKHPTLYLNFEHYIGISELLPERPCRSAVFSDRRCGKIFFTDADGHPAQRRSGLHSPDAQRSEPVGNPAGRVEKPLPTDRRTRKI